MKLQVDIHTKDYKQNPSYRVFVNNEFITERTYFVPENEEGHYRFYCNLKLNNGENNVSVQGLDGEFTMGKLWLDGVKINHKDGVFKA